MLVRKLVIISVGSMILSCNLTEFSAKNPKDRQSSKLGESTSEDMTQKDVTLALPRHVRATSKLQGISTESSRYRDYFGSASRHIEIRCESEQPNESLKDHVPSSLHGILFLSLSGYPNTNMQDTFASTGTWTATEYSHNGGMINGSDDSWETVIQTSTSTETVSVVSGEPFSPYPGWLCVKYSDGSGSCYPEELAGGSTSTSPAFNPYDPNANVDRGVWREELVFPYTCNGSISIRLSNLLGYEDYILDAALTDAEGNAYYVGKTNVFTVDSRQVTLFMEAVESGDVEVDVRFPKK